MKANFKKQISILSLVLSSILIFSSCEEKPWSENYDINWPVTTIESVTPLTAAPGDVLTISGQNLNYTLNFYVGDFDCEIVEGSATATQLRVIVPELASGESQVKVYNAYRREFIYKDVLTVTPAPTPEPAE